MIRLEFFKDFSGFYLSGHSGYASNGNDIICAAVSSAAQQTLIAITEVRGIDAKVSVDNENAALSLMIKPETAKSDKEFAADVIRAFKIQCECIDSEYPGFMQFSNNGGVNVT
ncbi:MAG: ribosomal-processing cysteine protease Prp [Bacillota bacterium]|nr:ribosomal-processing cysteine protease Prp [Bacillota bacterium]